MEAKLRLPKSTSSDVKEKLVEGLITRLSLTSCADTVVGDKKTRGLSGGEKKRLALACELIGSPALIFADEPTTGLDSFQAEKVMATLKELAESGHTVVCTIHQPRGSIYKMFDDLMLMSAGRLVYYGTAAEAVPAFVVSLQDMQSAARSLLCLRALLELEMKAGLPNPEGENPAEYLIDQIAMDNSSPEGKRASEERVARLVALQREASKQASMASMANSSSSGNLGVAMLRTQAPRSSVWAQFKMLFKRAWRQVTRDKATNIARLSSSIGSAVIFGTIFFRIGYTQAAVQSRMGLMQFGEITHIQGAMKCSGVPAAIEDRQAN
eukprot:scaffold90212_cov48-Prasinocladus_malaysianus.AAC.1